MLNSNSNIILDATSIVHIFIAIEQQQANIVANYIKNIKTQQNNLKFNICIYDKHIDALKAIKLSAFDIYIFDIDMLGFPDNMILNLIRTKNNYSNILISAKNTGAIIRYITSLNLTNIYVIKMPCTNDTFFDLAEYMLSEESLSKLIMQRTQTYNEKT